MRWLVALVLALVMVTPAFAGEAPYFATVTHVGPFPDPPDISANYWYISPKHQQFLLNEVGFLGTDAMCWPISGTTQQCEQFKSLTPQNQPEVCFYDPEATDRSEPGNGKFPNAVVRAGNAGKFEWYVRLPRKPSGEINLVLECGVLKPNSFSFWKYRSIEMCAAETGERVGPNCTRTEVAPGTNPLITRALPTITAVAYPGPYNHPFPPFNLTAFRNPGSYSPFSGVNLLNGAAAQLLDGVGFPDDTKIVLKACMDKTIITKLPVTGQINAIGSVEMDLEYGDLIYVRLDIPRYNSVDIYCHQQSLKLAGVGETWF